PVDSQEYFCLLNGRALVTGAVRLPRLGVAWAARGAIVAATLPAADVEELQSDFFLDERKVGDWLGGFRVEPTPEEVRLIDHPWDLIHTNGSELRRQCRGGGVVEGRVFPGVHLLNEGEIQIAAGAMVKPGVVLDAERGPIHIDEDAVIEPNAVV